MSLIKIRAALEVQLATISPALKTVWEGQIYQAVTYDVPYQSAVLLVATPVNLEMGKSYAEHGIFQINLHYSINDGTKDIVTRAELTRDTFPKNSTLAYSGVSLIITNTPEISSMHYQGKLIQCSVRVNWSSQLIGV